MPLCPDCGTELHEERNRLTEQEYTHVLDCPDCQFGIESMSNLAWRDRFGGGVHE